MAGQYVHGFPMGRRAVEKNTGRMVPQWPVQKDRLGHEGPRLTRKEELPYKLANTCTVIIREKEGVVGDVARLIGGSLVSPAIDPVHIQRYFRYLKSLWGRGRASHDCHRRDAGECSSVRSRSRTRVTVRKPQQCHRAHLLAT